MWKAWNDTVGENDIYPPLISKQDLVLSWKQLSVTVTKKTSKFFSQSELIHKRILDNGNYHIKCYFILNSSTKIKYKTRL